jgi:hypothetical protein
MTVWGTNTVPAKKIAPPKKLRHFYNICPSQCDSNFLHCIYIFVLFDPLTIGFIRFYGHLIITKEARICMPTLKYHIFDMAQKQPYLPK